MARNGHYDAVFRGIHASIRPEGRPEHRYRSRITFRLGGPEGVIVSDGTLDRTRGGHGFCALKAWAYGRAISLAREHYAQTCTGGGCGCPLHVTAG